MTAWKAGRPPVRQAVSCAVARACVPVCEAGAVGRGKSPSGERRPPDWARTLLHAKVLLNEADALPRVAEPGGREP